jgi:diguanylate cyclase (GGDEF)-like protein
VAVAEHGAIAVQSAQEAAEATRYRRALEELLAVSSRLADAATVEEILPALCSGIREALGFRSVTIQLVDPATGRLEPKAVVGTNSQPVVTVAELEPLLEAGRELEGCYLLETAEESPGAGRGPHAWRNHRLVVPLQDRDGVPIGLIAADEPEDRLLPTREHLQALRVFANQATAAISSAAQLQELTFLADHDPLTRLLNRRAFAQRLEAEVARTTRYGHGFSLVVCDLDGFKALNDRLGHAAGDEALRQFADSLAHALRRPDDAFRIGGDEFALLLAEADDADALEVVARVTTRLEASADNGTSTTIRASFGVASCPAHATDPQTLFRLADEALYRAKRAGGTVQFAA